MPMNRYDDCVPKGGRGLHRLIDGEGALELAADVQGVAAAAALLALGAQAGRVRAALAHRSQVQAVILGQICWALARLQSACLSWYTEVSNNDCCTPLSSLMAAQKVFHAHSEKVLPHHATRQKC